MTLSELEAALTAQTTPQGLPLSAGVSPAVGGVVSPLQLTRLLVRNPVVTRPADGELSLKGQADAFGGTVGVELRGTGEADPALSLRLDLPAHWSFEDGFPGLPPSFKADPEHGSVVSRQHSLLYDLVLSGARLEVTPATRQGPAAVRFSGTTGLPGAYGRLQRRLGLEAQFPVTGTVTPRRDGPAGVDLLLARLAAPLSVGGLAIQTPELHLCTRTGPDGSLTQLLARGKVLVGTTDPVEVDVTAEYEGDEDYFVFRAELPPPGLTVSRGVAALVELAGGTAQDFALPPGLDVLDAFGLQEVDVHLDAAAGRVSELGVQVGSDRVWKIVDGLAVNGIFVRWRVYSPLDANRALSVGLGGVLSLGTERPVRFDVSAAGPGGWSVEGRLRPDTPIVLSELVQTALGFSADLPRTEVDALTIAASTEGDFRLDGSIASDWTVDVGGRPFALERVEFALHRTSAATLARIRARAAVAGSRLYVQATATRETGTGTGIEFEGGTLPTGDPISLTGVAAWALEQFGASLPSAVPDVTLKNLKLRFNTASKEFHFEGETDVPIEVPFLPGDRNKIHAAANLTSKLDSATGKRTLQGWMEGDLTIGSSLFTLRYEMGQATHVFQASWTLQEGGTPLGINTLLDAIGAKSMEIPSGVDLNLTRVYFEYQAELGTLTLVADSRTYGEAFLIASKPPADPAAGGGDGGWTFVFGLEYNASKLSQVPVLGSAMGAADLFHFEELGILVSSGEVKSFALPQLPALQSVGGDSAGSPSVATTAAGAARKPVAAGKTVAIKEGISFIGIIDLASSDSGGGVQTLRSVVPTTRLTITAGYDAGAEEFMLTGVLDGSVTIPTGGSSDLRLGNAKLQLGFPNPIEFRVSGTLDFTLDHQPVHVEPALLLTETEAAFTVDVDFGPDGWKSPMGIQGVTLDEVGFGVAVNFEPPGVSMGLQGAAHVGAEAPKSDQFAFMLEMVEEVPNPLLLSFQVARLSVEEALRVFVPSAPVSDLPEFVQQIRFTDLAFYWADSIVVLPDGTTANPGLRFRGNVQILDFAAHAAVQVDTSGLMGELMLSPVHIGNVVSITGGGQGVYRYERNGKPVMPQVRPDPKLPAPTRVAVVPPGGAVAQFRTKQSPWLYASVNVSLFGLLSESIEALVSAEGVHFKLVYAITSAVNAELECTLDKSGFKAHAKFGLHLKADLGPIRILGVDLGTIHLDAGFDLEMTVEVQAGRFLLQVAGDFEFEGARLAFPTLRIDVAPSSLADLPARLISHLAENVEEIFADLFNEAKHALEAAAREVEKAAEAVAREVEQIGKAAVEEAEKIAKDAEEAVVHAAEAVAKEAERVEQEAVKIAQEAAAEVEKIGKAAVDEVERIGGEIARVAEAAEHEVEAIGREIAHEAQVVEQAVEQLATEAVHQVEAIAHAVEAEVQTLLADARKVADDIVNAARYVVNQLEQQAQALWNEARHLAEEIAEAARRAAQAVEDAAESAWNTIKKY